MLDEDKVSSGRFVAANEEGADRSAVHHDMGPEEHR